MKAFHLVGPAPFYTNSFLLISDAGSAVVIDPAAEVQEYDKILKEHGGRLSLILCTHGHYDHVGSAGVLSREWGAKLYCEPADCRGTQLLPLKGSDSGYEEGEVIPLDELRFTVWHTPGHTEGSVVLLCENYLFVGDTVFQGSIGRTDLEGGDSRKMDESLRKFAALPVPAEAQVLPGHGDFSTFGQEAGHQLLYQKCAEKRIKRRDLHMNIYITGLGSGYEVEHLVRLFYPMAPLTLTPPEDGAGLRLGREAA